MDTALYFPLLCCTLFISTSLLVFFVRKQPRNESQKLPPGPPGWPIIGNMLELGTKPHVSLYNLKPKYGPILWLKLGSLNTMIVQSAKAAEQLFKYHDLSFSDRKVVDCLTVYNYHQGSLVLGNYGSYWRFLRRLCTVELMVNKRINETAKIRQKCVDNLIKGIEEEYVAKIAKGESGKINLAHSILVMSFNLIGNMVFSKDLLDSTSKEGKEFFDAMENVFMWAGKPNVVDFLPFFKWLDPQRIRRNMKEDMGKALKIIYGFVEERKKEHKFGKQSRDFLDVLLEYEGDENEGLERMSPHKISIFVLDLFFAGTETTSSTIEWAMSELLCKPESLRKAKEELSEVIGVNKKKVEESDIDDLPYLKAIIKETLRLHPPGPFLVPRNAMKETQFMGYLIPKDTLIYVNVWAIGRDPESWDDSFSFKPERFLNSNIDYNGHNFELLPFGSGRRICVAMSLAHRLLHLILASLLHQFDWELGGNVRPEDVDMKERIGATLRKLVPLEAVPKKCVF